MTESTISQPIIYQKIEEALTQLEQANSSSSFIQQLATYLDKQVAEILQMGTQNYEQRTEGLSLEEKYDHYQMAFQWMERAKSYVILWRNVLFEQIKAHHLYLDKTIELSQVTQLQSDALRVLKEAYADFQKMGAEEKAVLQLKPNGLEKQIELWHSQQHPWPSYQEQLEQLPAQTEQLLVQYNTLQDLSTDFDSIREAIQQQLVSSDTAITTMRSIAKEAVQYIEGHTEDKPIKLAQYAEDQEGSIDSAIVLENNTPQIEQQLEPLMARQNVVVKAEQGLLYQKDYPIKRAVRQWVESEILLVLKEIREHTNATIKDLKMALLNIKNRATLLSKEKEENPDLSLPTDSLCQPLHGFLKKLEQKEEQLNELKSTVKERLQAEFRIGKLYEKDTNFLSVRLQSSLNQYRISQNQLSTYLKNVFQVPINTFNKLRNRVTEEQNLTNSEKIVRFVQDRTFSTTNDSYQSIFMTKGFIGESFWVGREDELERMGQLIELWKTGFRGAVMITGKRQSGRSLFGDMVAQRFFPQNTIRLQPKSSLRVEGRSFETTYNLNEALDFIRKYTLNKPSMIWIDDLELWRDPSVPFSQNIRALCRQIDDYSGQLFFMVSMTNWVKAYLKTMNGIDNVFQSEICMDTVSVDEIHQAILIRHGATHKNLVDEKGVEINGQQFQKMVSRIYRQTNGNMGESLKRWALNTSIQSSENVIHEPKMNSRLPDFINRDNAPLLKTILQEKRTNEYRLRKTFGVAFKEKYASIVQRLIGVGLLKRDADGWLEVNEIAANQVALLLHDQEYLQFYNK